MSADGATDYLKTFGDHFPVRGFLLSMGLPQDNAEFFVDCVRLMSGGTDSPTDESPFMVGWNRVSEYWKNTLDEPPGGRPSTPMSTSSPTSRGRRWTASPSRTSTSSTS